MLHFFLTDYFLRDLSYERYEFFNFELAKWAEYYLSQKIAFHQSNWCAGKVTENPHDILLGNPTYDMPNASIDTGMGNLHRDWVRDNALQPSDVCHPNTYIIFPWVPEFPQEWTPNLVHVESQLLAARKIFALCGQIWIDRTLAKMDNSIQAQVKYKLVQCNIGVATQNLPFIKQKFNPIGQRQLLHISTLGSYKGFDLTCESIQGLDARLNVASKSLQASPGLVDVTIDGKKYGFNFLGAVSNADPQFNQWVVDNCDFYIHTATMDAQATVILENCARGLIPLVTPESGYASPYAIYLTHNPEENRQIIQQALNLPESELLERSRLVRQHILEEHNWEKIFDKIWDEISSDMNSRSSEVNSPVVLPVDLPNTSQTGESLEREWTIPLHPDTLISIQNASFCHSYRGIPMIKNPFDISLYQMLLWEQKPRTIIEIGTAIGGSALWLADLLTSFGIDGHVYSIDIKKLTTVSHPLITLLEGDQNNLQATLSQDFMNSINRPLLVIEDGAHFYESTLAVLNFFHPHLQAGEYIIIEDGIVSQIGADQKYRGGPNRAVKQFLAEHNDEYEVDRYYCDFYGHNLTWNINGYLRKTQDSIEQDEILDLQLRESNLIIFPDWSAPESIMAEDLAKILKVILTYPDRDRTTLLIDTSNIDPETADGLIAEVVMHLLIQDELEIDTEPQISLITELNDQQWQDLLQQVKARIPLVHDNDRAITRVGADHLPLKTFEDLL